MTMDVRAWPCDPTSDDWRNGPNLANNAGGIAGAGSRAKPTNIKWEGIDWRCVVGLSTLWILAPERGMVEAHRPALERLAAVVYDRGSLEAVEREVYRSGTGTLVPRQAKVRNAPPASKKRMALNGVTQAVNEAIELGATVSEVRMAVYAALGLEDA